MFSKRFRIITGLVVVCSLAFASYFWFLGRQQVIVTYKASRDRDALLHIYDQNYFWLTTTPDQSSAHANFAYSLATRSSSRSPRDKNNLSIFVCRDEGQTKGFIAYYLKSPVRAKILYIAVHKGHRRKGYAAKLLQYAIDRLEQRGVKQIELHTRLANKRARGLYEKFNFRPVWVDDEYVDFERISK